MQFLYLEITFLTYKNIHFYETVANTTNTSLKKNYTC